MQALPPIAAIVAAASYPSAALQPQGSADRARNLRANVRPLPESLGPLEYRKQAPLFVAMSPPSTITFARALPG